MAFPRLSTLFGVAGLALLGAAGAAAAPLVGPDTGKPVPRYESLRYGEVNGRLGPSTEHRLLWTYRRRGLPVRVVAESGPWRQVVDPAGDVSWVHGAGLDARHTVFVSTPDPVSLRKKPSGDARTVARLEQGVVASVKACRGAWALIRTGDYEGWTESRRLWGAEGCGR